MKKQFLLFTVLWTICIAGVFAQNNNPEAVFGKIRAEMVRDASEKLGVPDSIRAKITDSSLKKFNSAISTNPNWKILTTTPVLLTSYTSKVCEDKLKVFNEDLGKKIKGYDKKKFDKKIEEASNKIIVAESQVQEKIKSVATEGEGSSKKEIVSGKKQGNQGNSFDEMQQIMSEINSLKKKNNFLFLFILSIVLLIVLLFVLIKRGNAEGVKRKNHALDNRENKQDNKNMNKDISENNTTPDTSLEDKDNNIEKEKNINDENRETAQEVDEKTTFEVVGQPHDKNKNAFAQDADDWIVVGASVTGNGHKSTDTPCQDNHRYEYLGDGWGIAIVSDGAGSATMSDKGSKLVVLRGVEAFKMLIEQKAWKKENTLPTDKEWEEDAYIVLKQLRKDMELLANKLETPLKSLSATAIVVIHTPMGIMATHVGDGRAGYKNEEGKWLALFAPHKGEEANQTIFLTSDFWEIPFFKISERYVPDSVVIREKPFGFVLMSDGCETTSWQCYSKEDNDERYYDPNIPHPGFFKPIDKTLQSFREKEVPLSERAEKWWSFIESGNPSFVKETDDKTMIVGVLKL